MKTKVNVPELAKMIDHSLLHPAMTDEKLKKECEIAVKYGVASVCIKPYAVRLAKSLLKATNVKVGTVVGFPHGNSPVETKIFETEQVCREGAEEVDMVVNIGKVLSRDWEYVRSEIGEMVAVTHSNGAILKVIFENDFLPEDEFKIQLCRICSDLGVDFVKTSTGFGFIKGPDGKYAYNGATDHDLKLMRKYSAPDVQVKAAGGIRTLDDLLRVRLLGVTRVGATATAAILEEAKKRLEQ
ncbi:MAG: deoxyribose-phosphate aldolase [Chlorobi bacterium]|nr:deoxyribose-phosphate aldolase [Chlorobiota bacterium]